MQHEVHAVDRSIDIVDTGKIPDKPLDVLSFGEHTIGLDARPLEDPDGVVVVKKAIGDGRAKESSATEDGNPHRVSPGTLVTAARSVPAPRVKGKSLSIA